MTGHHVQRHQIRMLRREDRIFYIFRSALQTLMMNALATDVIRERKCNTLLEVTNRCNRSHVRQMVDG